MTKGDVVIKSEKMNVLDVLINSSIHTSAIMIVEPNVYKIKLWRLRLNDMSVKRLQGLKNKVYCVETR